jgi:hypothetical protein
MKIAWTRIIALSICTIIVMYFGLMLLAALFSYGDYASTTPHLVRYVLIPALLATFFVCCGLFLPRRASLLVGLNGAALLAGLFAFELLQTIEILPVRLGGLGGRTGAESAERDFLPGIPLKAMNGALNVEHLHEAMLAGVPNRRTLLCTRERGPIAFDADRLGFNNPDGVHERSIDVAVLGDSFVEGFCLSPGRDVVARLRVRHPASVSVATRGNGPLIELAALGRYGPVLKPRHVVMVFFEGNDWRNLASELSKPWLRAVLAEGAEYGPVPAPEPTLSRAEKLARERGEREVTATDILFSIKFIRQFLALNLTGTKLGLAYSMAPRDHPEYAEVLRRAKRMTEGWGGRFTLLYLPRVERHLGLFPRDFVFDHLRDKVAAAARATGVEMIDLVPIFAAVANPRALYAEDGHFSEEGAALAAGAIADHVDLPVAGANPQRPKIIEASAPR